VNKDTIEGIAKRAVEDAVLPAEEKIKPFISENDKEPVFDGSFYVYPKGGRKVEDLLRVPTQVKGTTQKLKMGKNTRGDTVPLFAVQLEHIKSYYAESGILFFVVSMDEDGGNKQIFYRSLLPVDLKPMLEEIKNKKGNLQKSREFCLEKFPTDKVGIEQVFFTFIENRKAQKGKEENFVSLDSEYFQKNDSNQFRIRINGAFDPNINPLKNPADLCGKDIYMYIPQMVAGKEIELPVAEKIVLAQITQNFEKPQQKISLGNKEFNSNIRFKHSSKKEVKCIIDNFLIFSFFDNKVNISFSIKHDSLKQVIRNLELVIAFIEEKKIQFYDGAPVLDFKEEKDKFEAFKLSQLKKEVASYKNIEKTLEYFNYHDDLTLSDIDDNGNKNLSMLANAAIGKKTIKMDEEKYAPLVFISIANINLLVAVDKLPNNEYAIENVDSFDKMVVRAKFDESDYEVSLYSSVLTENFPSTSNLDYDHIYQSYVQLKGKNPFIEDLITYRMLELIDVYDKTENNNCLDLASRFNEWLRDNDNRMEKDIYKLNYYQIKKRKEQLNDNELQEILQIAEDAHRYTTKIGAHILLDNKKQVEFYFNKLDNEEKNTVKSWPIFNIYGGVI